jgi:hypothetical protein
MFCISLSSSINSIFLWFLHTKKEKNKRDQLVQVNKSISFKSKLFLSIESKQHKENAFDHGNHRSMNRTGLNIAESELPFIEF